MEPKVGSKQGIEGSGQRAISNQHRQASRKKQQQARSLLVIDEFLEEEREPKSLSH